MRISFLVMGAAASVFIALPAHPEEPGIKACALIESNLDRLSCYDKLSGRTPTVNVNQSAESPWNVRIETSKLTDLTNVFIQNSSRDDIECGRYSNSPARLVLRCMDNVTTFYVSTDCHLTSSEYNNYGQVTYRIDDHPASKIDMVESTSNDSLGLWRGNRAIPFIKKMLGADTLLLQFTPYGQSPVLAEFNISDLDKAIAPLREACKW